MNWIILICAIAIPTEMSRECVEQMAAHRRSISGISLEIQHSVGDVDWPEAERSERSVNVWSNFEADRHRVDIFASGFREVYGFQCPYPGQYLEYLEHSPNGTFVAKFDDGTVAPKFLSDIRVLGNVCRQMSQLVELTPGSYFANVDLAEVSLTHPNATHQQFLEAKGIRLLEGHRFRSFEFRISSNAKQRVMVDLDAGPSMVFSEIEIDSKQDGFSKAHERVFSQLELFDGVFWFPRVVTFERLIDAKPVYIEHVRVVTCEIGSVPPDTFTLKGIGLKTPTLVSRSGHPWSRWNGHELITESNAEVVNKEDAVDLRAFVIANLIGLAGLLFILFCYRGFRGGNSAVR